MVGWEVTDSITGVGVVGGYLVSLYSFSVRGVIYSCSVLYTYHNDIHSHIS